MSPCFPTLEPTRVRAHRRLASRSPCWVEPPNQRRRSRIRAGSSESDWREFRRKLIEQSADDDALSGKTVDDNMTLLQTQNQLLAEEPIWAHEGPPEAGGLLLSTDECSHVLSDHRKWQLVVYLSQHDASGTRGLILNRPTGYSINDVAQKYPSQDFVKGFSTAFSREKLYLGGFSGNNQMAMMHGKIELPGAVETSPGVCFGDAKQLQLAVNEVVQGKAAPHEFKFFLGHMQWEVGALEEEISKGAWWCVAASRSIVLKQCVKLPVPLWKEVQMLMGGEFRQSVEITGSIDE